MTILHYVLTKLLRLPRRIRMLYFIQWNRIVLWINGAKVGKSCKIFNRLYLIKHPNASLKIGNDFLFSSDEAFNPLCRNLRGCIFLPFSNSVIEIGNGTGISSACLWAKEKIIIGNGVNIGGDCILMDTDAHNLDYRIRASREMIGNVTKDDYTAASAPITIQDNVLIGTRCIILKGVTIGARSIIGSGSVVTKSIPADCIAAGNPCKVIRFIDGNVGKNACLDIQ